MDKSNIIEKEEEKEFGNEVQTILYRVPKKNHDAMVELNHLLIYLGNMEFYTGVYFNSAVPRTLWNLLT